MSPASRIAYYESLVARAKPMELDRYYATSEELWNVERKLAAGEITQRERDRQVLALYAQQQDSIIEFDTEDEFAQFCKTSPPLHEQYVHEQEHAAVYRARRIPYRFGFVKIISRGHVGLIPWILPQWPRGISTREQIAITIASIENATDRSPGDEQDLAALMHIRDLMR